MVGMGWDGMGRDGHSLVQKEKNLPGPLLLSFRLSSGHPPHDQISHLGGQSRSRFSPTSDQLRKHSSPDNATDRSGPTYVLLEEEPPIQTSRIFPLLLSYRTELEERLPAHILRAAPPSVDGKKWKSMRLSSLSSHLR